MVEPLVANQPSDMTGPFILITTKEGSNLLGRELASGVALAARGKSARDPTRQVHLWTFSAAAHGTATCLEIGLNLHGNLLCLDDASETREGQRGPR